MDMGRRLSTQCVDNWQPDLQTFNEEKHALMIQFSEGYPEEEIVVTLSRQLRWAHFLAFFSLIILSEL